MAHYSTANTDNSFLHDIANSNIPNPEYHWSLLTCPYLPHTIENHTGEWRVLSLHTNPVDYSSGALVTEQVRIKLNENKYACYIAFPCKEYLRGVPTGNTYTNYMVLMNGTPAEVFSDLSASVVGDVTRGNDFTVFSQTRVSISTNVYNYTNFNSVSGKADILTRFSYFDPDVSNTFLSAIIDEIPNIRTGSYDSYQTTSFGTIAVKHDTSTTIYNDSLFMPQYKSLSLPVFEYDNWRSVIKYLTTGDDSGSIDPFDPLNPEVITVTDYSTNFVMNLSANSPTSTKVSITARNQEYLDGGYALQGRYASFLSYSRPTFKLYPDRVNTGQGTPTTTFDVDLSGARAGSLAPTLNPMNFCFGDIDLFDGDTLSAAASHSGMFSVILEGSKSSKVNAKVYSVSWSSNVDGSSSTNITDTREVYGDGYKYTAPSGETLIVLFKSISLDQLENIRNTGYPYTEDEENALTGSDNIALFGTGLRTYHISDGAFDAVNRELWTTNWSEVFKSNTINPITCVITSKRIPFTLTGSATDTLYLANRAIDIGVGYIVNPIKSYNVATYTMEALHGNFVDIKYARVRVWLPYIGWVELPASEVMTRVSRPQVGLISATKTLNFKYIVDFVDGNVRCVISVNGTERWCFDGNCAIDVPVTSDNHTAAVATAIRNGVGAALKIAGGVASFAAGTTMTYEGGGLTNAGLLAVTSGATAIASGVQQAPNAVPTYEFTTSTNPSGYIEASMNKHIMIVIEYPNAFYPNNYSHDNGYPCYLNLSLGECSGFTKTLNVDTTSINCLGVEQEMIKAYLDSGVDL